MDISVIIPTYNRPDDLKATVRSILKQSMLPKEIIIVDSAMNTHTEVIIKNFKSIESRVSFQYISNQIDSLTVARNIGSEAANSDILLFLDDDVALEETYIEEILKVYNQYPDCLIVQGNIISSYRKTTIYRTCWNKFWNFYCRFFSLHYNTSDEMKVLKSGNNTTPSTPDRIVNCQWASGCNFSIKKEIFNVYKFDSKLIKYSYGEDKDFSFRIFKENRKAVLLTPFAKLIHKGSFNKNSPVKKAIIMEKTYSLYFIAKNLDEFTNYSYFFWSEIGNFMRDIICLALFFRKRGRYFTLKLRYDLYAYYICIRHFSKIKNLNIEYINNKYLL